MSSERAKGWYHWIVRAILMAVLGLAAADAVLAPAPAPRDPDFIGTILASRSVVSAIRISIIFAATFVVLSVIALSVRRQWLRRIGPVEVSEEVLHLDFENRDLEARLGRAREEIEELKIDVAFAQQLIEMGYGRDQRI